MQEGQQEVSLPVVDLSAPPEVVATALREAAQTIGFFYVTGHGIPEALFEEHFEQLRAFFCLPLEEKMKIHTSKTGGVRGYIGIYEQGNYGIDESDKRAKELLEAASTEQKNGEQTDGEKVSDAETTDETAAVKGEDGLPMDLKEVFTMGTELPEDNPHYKASLFAKNIFPSKDKLKDFETVVLRYYESVWEVATMLFRYFAEGLGLPSDYFDSKITHPMNSMNCLHYPPYSGRDPQQLGIGAHTDYECFTLLAQGDVPGLEILLDGGRWTKVSIKKGAFVVNIGDMMARWSNGAFKSTVHRARNPSALHRYSCAYFCCCNYDVPLEALVDRENPKYKVVLAGDHLVGRIERANVYTGEQGPPSTAVAESNEK
uniref:Fe2OG dioxygenase domain-containing protein n=1 Tax=Chromera velia CCMP2878 TaxID=1169474 RepID=A0A0G4I0X5_9ALVE|mmetsp:Transcript_1684/g.3477  ORF Transcript_1684/g.3477 Transcript_1684/m.3477 type:complete len:373 (+) Transcript_1684:266-1384(+)|eukprot:Cvel_10062.t1-p1 / transcript=Cvel_10062.t1 / gene=Cvel_10062 / organism=Chromera_velia_CCMP2878 / gene_product=Sexual differentiation process protein isp7, putative / transcript_product=Sexual differentiation process protein isp7, putative / location=Cvel_scaffold598:69320-74834(-) / protein_length=372 / sequence_SO=supercontig / SO=protein_coding / is_pseudo=false